jgi:hypothetical protein
MHIVEANDWKDAAITLLEPRSPYRPWRTGPDPLRAEERVLAVLRTDPVSVLTVIGYADANGNATFGRYTSLDLLDATTLALIADIPRTKDPRLNWTLGDSTGEDIEIALEELWLRDPFLRFGHTRRGPNPVAVTWRLRRLRQEHRPSWARCPRPHSHPHRGPADARQRACRLAGGRMHAVPRHDGRQLPRLPIRTPPAVPQVPSSPHDEEPLWDARRAVFRAVAARPRLLRHRGAVDLHEMPAHMVMHSLVTETSAAKADCQSRLSKTKCQLVTGSLVIPRLGRCKRGK